MFLLRVITAALFFFIFALINPSWAERPSLTEIKHAVSLVPAAYQKDVEKALRKSGSNGAGLVEAVDKSSPVQREGMAFLIANMPGPDLTSLKKDLLIENNELAYQVMQEVPWGRSIPQDIFLNDILPYASINERRDNWRADFHKRFIAIAQKSKTIDQAVLALNKYVFDTLHVSYNPDKRPKPDQSPYESTEAHYASCTGLSVLLTDALRSVGIPARITGTAMWADNSGNHTWVEIWDGQWHYIGAAEPAPLDHTWFTSKAAHANARHPICATSFKKTRIRFPMRWAPNLKFVFAEDVTGDYKH